MLISDLVPREAPSPAPCRRSRPTSRTIPILLACLACLPPALAGQAREVGVRVIATRTENEAEDLRDRILEGAVFDRVAREHSIDPSSKDGGYLGRFVPAEMPPELRGVVEGLGPGEVSSPVRSASGYLLFGITTVREQQWFELGSAGAKALDEGRFEDAGRQLESAFEIASGFGAGDYRLLLNLRKLADLGYLRGDYVRAVELYERWEKEAGGDPLIEDTERARVLGRLGESHRVLGNMSEASVFLERSVGMPGAAGDERAASLRSLAFVRRALGDYREAESLARSAVEILEASPTAGPATLATGLHELSVILTDRQEYADAAAAARRSLEFFESSLEPDDPALSDSLVNLAHLIQIEGDAAEARALYRRALAIVSGFGAGAGTDRGLDALDQLTTLLGLAPFSGTPRFEDAFQRFRDGMKSAGASEALYVFSARILVEKGYGGEAGALMSDAVDRFPDSAIARTEQATLYANMGQVVEAIEAFTGVTRRFRSGGDAWLDYSFRMIGYLQIGLADLASAEAAYRAAIEILPNNVGAHIGLGDTYFEGQEFDRARDEYLQAVALEPDGFAANLMLARTDLSLERFSEAAAAAGVAVRADPRHTEARFIRARSLMLDGEIEAGTSELERYRELQATNDRQSAMDSELKALRREAAPALAAGDYDHVIRLYRDAIDTYPDAADLRFTLASVWSEKGEHRTGVEALLTMVGNGMGNFVVQSRIAEEYRLLEETDAAADHELTGLLELYTLLRASI